MLSSGMHVTAPPPYLIQSENAVYYIHISRCPVDFRTVCLQIVISQGLAESDQEVTANS